MDSVKTTTLKGLPLYIFGILEAITQALPTLILWLTFLYGVIQLLLVCRQYWREYVKAK